MGEIASIKRTKEIILKHGFTFKKSLGQNFLIYPHILDQMIAAANLDKTMGVLEIGPGIGSLTERIAIAAGKVVAVEIDQRLIPILQEMFSSCSHVKILPGDFLKFNLQKLCHEQFPGLTKICVMANLPYYVTTPILMKLVQSNLMIEDIIVMVQKEVGERMNAKAGSKAYGSLSIAMQYYADLEIVCAVPQSAFVPRPKVESMVLRMKVRKEPPDFISDEKYFFHIVKASFSQRRKTILNNLVQLVGKEHKTDLVLVLESCGIQSQRRPETLAIHEFAHLSDELQRSGLVT